MFVTIRYLYVLVEPLPLPPPLLSPSPIASVAVLEDLESNFCQRRQRRLYSNQ